MHFHRCLRGGDLPLQGIEGNPDGVKTAPQLHHLVGGVEVALAGLIHRTSELTKLTPIIRRRR